MMNPNPYRSPSCEASGYAHEWMFVCLTVALLVLCLPIIVLHQLLSPELWKQRAQCLREVFGP